MVDFFLSLTIIGSTLTIVCNDLESALEALIKKGTDFANRLRPPSRKYYLFISQEITMFEYHLYYPYRGTTSNLQCHYHNYSGSTTKLLYHFHYFHVLL